MERHCILACGLFCLLSTGECTTEVRGFEGQNVTLPCKYDAKYWGLSHVCWGRGTIPTTGGCNNEIISTDGTKVTNRVLSRYQLLGDLMTGDVSLTIINTTEKDSGIYGCRMQHSGLFNDGKIEITLTIKKAPVPPTPRTPDNVTSPTWDYHTPDYVITNSTQHFDTFMTDQIKQNPRSHSYQIWILMSFLLVLIVLGIVSAFVFRKQLKSIVMVFKMPQRSGLRAQQMAIENVYEIEQQGDLDDYEVPEHEWARSPHIRGEH
ncbi:hypothetical protein DPEC_G00227530 [Dallia pectoralis]|uniref:Uncharacterized protein n=1 Tax=Dallia pectoralis TaxID=75939 RepID=A0ACC2G0N5_DALPE|nr:hypothetical protein DPEC_G00227530 [Dallia pectoralis]